MKAKNYNQVLRARGYKARELNKYEGICVYEKVHKFNKIVCYVKKDSHGKGQEMTFNIYGTVTTPKDMVEFKEGDEEVSEFRIRMEYVKYHVKELREDRIREVIFHCKLDKLKSRELKEVQELGLISYESYVGMCFERMEAEREDDKKRIDGLEKERVEDKKTIEDMKMMMENQTKIHQQQMQSE